MFLHYVQAGCHATPVDCVDFDTSPPPRRPTYATRRRSWHPRRSLRVRPLAQWRIQPASSRSQQWPPTDQAFAASPTVSRTSPLIAYLKDLTTPSLDNPRPRSRSSHIVITKENVKAQRSTKEDVKAQRSSKPGRSTRDYFSSRSTSMSNNALMLPVVVFVYT